jgi:hypothetical protein
MAQIEKYTMKITWVYKCQYTGLTFRNSMENVHHYVWEYYPPEETNMLVLYSELGQVLGGGCLENELILLEEATV